LRDHAYESILRNSTYTNTLPVGSGG
jgi:hypothetical protein